MWSRGSRGGSSPDAGRQEASFLGAAIEGNDRHAPAVRARVDVVLKTNRLYDGTHLAMPEVSHREAREIHVEPQDPQAAILVETDGETPGRLPATFKVLPGALRLRA